MTDVPVPKIQLSRIFRYRDKMIKLLHETFVGKTVSLEDVVSAIHRVLPGSIGYDVLFESVRQTATGGVLQRDDATRLAWRLAGNIDRLVQGLPVVPWTMQGRDEWTPLEIIRAVPGRSHKDQPGYVMTFRALAGTSCPNKLYKFWSYGSSARVSRMIGFSRFSDGPYPYSDAMELVGLRLFGFIEAARSRQSPWFHEVACPQNMITRNRKDILRLRLRVDTRCPRKYNHPCHKCPIGYEDCIAGTHYRTYKVGYCPKCMDPKSLFDPDLSMNCCLKCVTKAKMAKKGS